MTTEVHIEIGNTSREATPTVSVDGPSDPREGRPGPLALLLMATWFGLITGFLEVGLIVTTHLCSEFPFYHRSQHFIWMIPVSYMVLFIAMSLVPAAIALVSPDSISWFTTGLFCFPGALALLLNFPLAYIACLLFAVGFSFQIGRLVSAHAPGFRRVLRRTVPWLVILLAAMVAIMLGGESLAEYRALANLPQPPPGVPNVLLIVLDTVRADELSLYGYSQPTSPHLERLARRAVVFDRAFAAASWTLPSHASMFTGELPHRLSDGLISRGMKSLDESHDTIAEYLTQLGFVTAGFAANSLYCGSETGLSQGFVHYEDHRLDPGEVLASSRLGRLVGLRFRPDLPTGMTDRAWNKWAWDASKISRDLLDWISCHRDRPFFAFVNYFDAHDAYVIPGAPDFGFGRSPANEAEFQMLSDWWFLEKHALTDHDVSLARDAYDRCIAYLDEQLGRLFEQLEASGILRETLVIVTADHGEHFGVHDLYGHGGSLYQQEIRVPLLIRFPASIPSGRRVLQPVSLCDIPATIVDLLGVADAVPFPGRSLARHWKGGEPSLDPVISEIAPPAWSATANGGHSPVFRGSMKSLVLERMHYILAGDGSEELYDLDGDPTEQHNLRGVPEYRSCFEQCRAQLRRILGDPPS